MPFAPRMVRALRAMSRAARTLARLVIDTWTGCRRPWSLSVPSRCASRRPCTIAVAMSASFCWVSCIAADRLAERAARLAVLERGFEAGARGAHGPPADAEARLVEAARAALASPSRRGGPHCRAHAPSSKDSSDVTEARSDSLLCTSDVVKPRVPRSTRNPRTPASVGGPHNRDVGDGSVGDPHLGAVDHPVAAVPARRACASTRDRNRRRAR